MRTGFLRLFSLCVFLLSITACENKRFEANIAEEQYNINLLRIDQQLFSTKKDVASVYSWLQESEKNHPEFTNVYLSEIMRMGRSVDSTAAKGFMRFRNDTLWEGLQQDIDAQFADFSSQEQALENAIKRIRYFFPELAIPTLYTFNSGFNVAVYPSKTFLGVGLEWFVGVDNKYVKMLPPEGFPNYKKEGMQPDFLVSDAIRGWLLNNFYEPYYFQQDLLREMVFYGKILLLLEVALPDQELHEILQYNKEQFAWATQKQEAVWKQLIAQNLLFSTNAKDISRFTIDGPFTNGFTNDSAPRLGWYMGWQMVKQYANAKDLSLQEIIEEHNEKEILKAFRPHKVIE